MPHIKLPTGVPGVIGGMMFRPETAGPISEMTDFLLRGPNTLTPGERELIAVYVSSRNECYFCQASHRAAAAQQLDRDYPLVDAVRCDPESAPVSAKLKALLAIAGKVQVSGSSVAAEDIARAHAQGATDLEIHDTVLIAALFCMINRYVDGLATFTPVDEKMYDRMGKMMARKGYALPGRFKLWLLSLYMRLKPDRNASRAAR